jgi:hypothetical protein
MRVFVCLKAESRAARGSASLWRIVLMRLF